MMKVPIVAALGMAILTMGACSSSLQNADPEQPEPAPKPAEQAPQQPEPFEPLLPALPGAAAMSGPAAGPAPRLDVDRMLAARLPPPPEPPPDLREPPKDARKTSSGLVYRVLEKGTGTQHPRLSSVVEVQYTGWTADGKVFDSSVVRGQSASFPLAQVIRGWSEGLQLMVVGEKARLWIPTHLAYGDHPDPGAPAGPLVFDVELIHIGDDNPPPQ